MPVALSFALGAIFKPMEMPARSLGGFAPLWRNADTLQGIQPQPKFWNTGSLDHSHLIFNLILAQFRNISSAPTAADISVAVSRLMSTP